MVNINLFAQICELFWTMFVKPKHSDNQAHRNLLFRYIILKAWLRIFFIHLHMLLLKL